MPGTLWPRPCQHRLKHCRAYARSKPSSSCAEPNLRIGASKHSYSIQARLVQESRKKRDSVLEWPGRRLRVLDCKDFAVIVIDHMACSCNQQGFYRLISHWFTIFQLLLHTISGMSNHVIQIVKWNWKPEQCEVRYIWGINKCGMTTERGVRW